MDYIGVGDAQKSVSLRLMTGPARNAGFVFFCLVRWVLYEA